jgi:hypothetical protein
MGRRDLQRREDAAPVSMAEVVMTLEREASSFQAFTEN